MLPDIPILKEEIRKKLQTFFKHRVNAYLGVISEAPRCLVKEGRRSIIIRPDGRIDETQLKVSSAETSVRMDEVPRLSLQDRLTKLDEVAREMASQISEHAFRQIKEAVERVGNVVEAGGRPLSPEVVLEVLETIQLEFDNDNKHHPLTFVVPPGMEQRAKETLEKLQRDPKYSKHYEELIAKKRMEWRDREATRKLVG